ncbi:hypothetical protein GCM10020367_69240 [Streptomyces sannanensis]|uniref:DUF4352 domain-containing protein n=1 Tax=Streptomyces sannanensis TaxID=285536 RepID=A0ABP6SMD4_9ACTN
MKNAYKVAAVSTILVLAAGGVALGYELRGGCGSQEGRAEKIAGLEILQEKPEGAHPASGSEKVEYGCVDDGGGWLYANRHYAFEGSNRQVVDFYRGIAQKQGLSLDEEGREASDTLAGLCFSKEVDDKPVLVRIRFNPPGGSEPGDYTIGAEAALDGERIRCWL